MLHAVLFLSCLIMAQAEKEHHSVFIENGEFVVRDRTSTSKDFLPGEVVQGSFDNAINSTGWSFLAIQTNPDVNDTIAAAAAGFYEGYTTATLLEQAAFNGNLYSFEPTEAPAQFLIQNQEFMTQQIELAKSLPKDDILNIYWYQVNLLLIQLSNIYSGYQAVRQGNGSLTETMILFLTLIDGDYSDIKLAHTNTSSSATTYPRRCSALLRLLPNNSDVFISQVTWGQLTSMLRIYKMYDFPYTLNGNSSLRVPAQRTAFSSSPGSLYSGDDFYVLSSGLVVQETTIGYFNDDLKQFVIANSVLEWARNSLANRLAVSGADWVNWYSLYNSGTYNNMNMILDYNLFVPGQPLVNGTFWLCEQVPGYIRSNDLSQMLENDRYFGSYNVAFDPLIRNVSGFDTETQQYGWLFDYYEAPRAQIFARDAINVNNMTDMEFLMRYNDFQHDPLSSQMPTCEYIGWTNCTPAYSPALSIACRADLNDPDGIYASYLGGTEYLAVDAKISSFSNFTTTGLYSRAQSGPTYYQQPVFQWSKSRFDAYPHVGQPDRWDFDWVDVSWD